MRQGKIGLAKKWHYFALISILILAIALGTLHYTIWGAHSFYGADGFNIMTRTKSIAIDGNHAFTSPGISDKMEIYPPGFYIILSSLMMLSGLNSCYLVYLLMICIQALFFPLIFFLLTVKVSKKFAVVTAFLSLILFEFTINAPTESLNTYFGILFVFNDKQSRFLMVILCILIIKKLTTIEHRAKYSLLFLFILTTIGLSHITPYIGFVSELIILLILIGIYGTFRKELINFHYLKNQLEIIIPIVISCLLTFLLYYQRAILYTPERWLPSFISPLLQFEIIRYTFILSPFLLFLFLVYILYLNYKNLSLNPIGKIPNKLKYGIIGSILIYHLFIVLYITIKKDNLIGLPVIRSIYPLIISFDLSEPLNIASQIIGWPLFFLSILGIYSLLSSNRYFYRFFGMFAGLSILISYVFLYPLQHPLYNDLFLTSIFYPLTVATGLSIIYKSLSKEIDLSSKFSRDFSKPIKKTSSILDYFLPLNRSRLISSSKKIIASFIIFGYIFTVYLYALNGPPALREYHTTDNPLKFGGEQVYSQYTYNTIVYTNHTTKDGEYILSSRHENKVLYITTHVRATSFSYRDKDNYKHPGGELVGALNNPEQLQNYLKKYNIRYIIIGIRTPDEIKENIERNPHLYQVYHSNQGETIFTHGLTY